MRGGTPLATLCALVCFIFGSFPYFFVRYRSVFVRAAHENQTICKFRGEKNRVYDVSPRLYCQRRFADDRFSDGHFDDSIGLLQMIYWISMQCILKSSSRKIMSAKWKEIEIVQVLVLTLQMYDVCSPRYTSYTSTVHKFGPHLLYHFPVDDWLLQTTTLWPYCRLQVVLE